MPPNKAQIIDINHLVLNYVKQEYENMVWHSFKDKNNDQINYLYYIQDFCKQNDMQHSIGLENVNDDKTLKDIDLETALIQLV